jgi:geranylgeranyl diphosphate synthase type II
MRKQKLVDFEEVLKEKQGLVWREVKNYLHSLNEFPDFCRISKRYQPLAVFHQKIASEYPQRKGKYLRPTLVLLTASAMGFDEKKAIKTAAAMQLSEEWILIHDDFEDHSLQRRGKSTLHRLYGEELAINAGDALHVLMWETLKDNHRVIGWKKTLAIWEEFCLMLRRTTLGQTAELKWMLENNQKLTDDDIFFILESKTTYYTVAGPMRLGAILAGATQKQLELIYKLGQPMGRCFQIRDDLLDLTSDFQGLKKQRGNDIFEGKRTVMLMHLFRSIKGKDRKKFLAIMKKGREAKSQKEVDWVIQMMEKYGSLRHGQELAEKLVFQAKEFFGSKLNYLFCQPARDQLKAAIDFINERDH